MTRQAVDELVRVRQQFDEYAATFSDAEWEAPSACAGWRVRDVAAHLAASARNFIDPLPLPPDRLPLPGNRERQHDVHVDVRRTWSTDDVLEEQRAFGDQLVERMVAWQREPNASRQLEVPGLGSYPRHAIANALVFDYYCHLFHDILGPGGPIVRVVRAPADATVYAAVQWMMWGLPQMQGPELAETLAVPVTIDLTGPGVSRWTITRPDSDGCLRVEELRDPIGPRPRVTVTSSAHAFVAWGTSRAPWREHCRIDGNELEVAAFLDMLDII